MSPSPNHIFVIALLAGLVSVGCDGGGGGAEADEPRAIAEFETNPGHQRMVQMLAKIAGKAPREHPQLGTAKAERLRANFESEGATMDGGRRCQLHLALGIEELKIDRIRESIEQLRAAHGLASGASFPNEALRIAFSNKVRINLGMAYMRLGETENCCQQYSAESCILPIQGAGIHTKQEGSREAIRYFEEVLREARVSANPFDHLHTHLAAKWLYNLAHMTVGAYPQDVPTEFLIDPSVFESDVEFPHFRNAGPDIGLDTFNLCGAVIVDDFDGDFDLDILTSSWDPTSPTKYFRNESDGSFTDCTESAGLAGMFGGLHMNQADYDNDGDLDVFVFRGAWGNDYGQHPNSLWQNDGAGRFLDVTFAAGLGDAHYPTQTGAWADYDNDGDLDLYIGNETSPQIRAPSQLFRNNGDGTFTDLAEQAGVQDFLFIKGAVWGDYDADRFPDLFVSVAGGDNLLYRNNGDGTFSDRAAAAGVTKPVGSFPAWFWDYDNDGALDLWVSATSGPVGLLSLFPHGVGVQAEDAPTRQLQNEFVVELMSLYRGDGKGGFTNASRQMGLDYPAQPMGCNFGDLDNDGRLDFYLGTGDVAYTELRPNLMYLNRGSEGFANVTMSGGFGHLQKGHGVSFADIDNDGDNDVYIQLGGALVGDRFYDALFENPGSGNRSISIQLEGRQSNRSAIGARIHIQVSEAGALRSIYRYIDSGGSFGCNPLRQTIGLGRAESIEKLEIYWPTTGKTQIHRDVDAGGAIRIVEGDGQIERIELRAFKLPGGNPG